MRKRTELSRAVICALMIGLSAYSDALLAANSGGSGVEYDTGAVFMFFMQVWLVLMLVVLVEEVLL